MIVVIDNYDSFTYNLVQYLGELGAEIKVFRNDQTTLEEIAALKPSHILISPGPGAPATSAGISNDVIRYFHARIPILGVCLGHQCITHVFGGRVDRAKRLMHGKVSRIVHEGHPFFTGLPTPFEATRYHSLIAYDPLPDCLQVLARTPEGEIMALTHRQAPTLGVQFHPESILTPDGKRLLRNFIAMSIDTGFALGISGVQNEATITSGIDMRTALEHALAREHLTTDEAEQVMMTIMSGQATPSQIGAYLAAIRAKGETVAEITGFARAMRQYVVRVTPRRRPLLDTCGTGGDSRHTFNISSTAAFIVSGAGVAVAKHGNRSVSSSSGSADVLMALGVNLELTPERVADCIDEVGMGFLFAPRLHPAMKHAIGPRREMAVRTVFNILGPLTNPAGAELQILGVYNADLVPLLANVLRELGSLSAFVVHGADGLDELSTTGPNRVAYLHNAEIQVYELDPADLGLPRTTLAQLRGGDPQQNAAITLGVLNGEPSPYRDIALLNAGLALVVAGQASTPQEGLMLAARSVDSGAARRVLEQLVAFTQAEVKG
ncbi:MAG: bifunctional anthranilate synthase component II/anthranilate phosphoribosyltransferase [Anaerolineae bacterium]